MSLLSVTGEQTRKILPGWGLGEHTDLAELVVSELVTNAMVHGAGQIEVRLSCGAACDLWAEVHDDGAGRPIRHRPGTDEECGRGLELTDGLIEMYGGTRGVIEDAVGLGKTVYVAIERAEPGATEVRTLASYVAALGGRLEIAAEFGEERVLLR